ncbi:hypothetical protein QJR52_06830 [Clostridium baratii]|uniref:hypothetical protein n=1 Tax=Clostridium baratii TaxID=1561 RepID=UPI0030D4AFF5
MKRIIGILLSILIVGTLFVGCGNSSPISKMNTKPVMNGTGDKEIGKYGEAKYNPDKITDEDLIKFYNEKVKNSGLNWVTLINKDNDVKEIVFPGSNNIIEYRTLNSNTNDYKVDASKIINNNKIEDLK